MAHPYILRSNIVTVAEGACVCVPKGTVITVPAIFVDGVSYPVQSIVLTTNWYTSVNDDVRPVGEEV